MSAAGSLQISAAVCRGFGAPLVWEELRLAPPEQGEVRVRIKACAICGSDITYMDGGWGGRLPAVFGHEAAGVVEAVGEGVGGVAVGAPVLATLLRRCGDCEHCACGAGFQCGGTFAIDDAPRLSDGGGAAVYAGLRTGAFAEYAVVHQSQIAPLPEGMDFAAASLLSCGVITGVGAVMNTAQMPPLSSALIVGVGGVGINCVQGARLCAAHPLAVADISDEKLALARGFGASHTFLSDSGGDWHNAAMAATGNRGFDFIFVAAGNVRAMEESAPLLARQGAMILVGMPPDGEAARIAATFIADGARRIIGSKMGSAVLRRDIPRLLRLHRDGQLELEKLISARYAPRQINDAIAAARAGGALRNVIVFD
jgi:Zn-dependent alcohol dehydrogenase